jgi:predicted ArsR family transcriptional regulator
VNYLELNSNLITIEELHRITPRKFEILRLLHKNKKIYAYDLFKFMNKDISYKGIRRNLRELLKDGLVDLSNGYEEGKTGRPVVMYRINPKGKLLYETLEKLLK